MNTIIWIAIVVAVLLLALSVVWNMNRDSKALRKRGTTFKVGNVEGRAEDSDILPGGSQVVEEGNRNRLEMPSDSEGTQKVGKGDDNEIVRR